MMEYFSWWMTAIALAGVTLFYWAVLNRPLGVSGSWARVVLWKRESYIAKADKPFQSQPNTMVAALMAATMEEFGEEAVQDVLANHKGEIPGLKKEEPSRALIDVQGRFPWTGHLLFLLMVPLGAYIASLFSGSNNFQMSLGELHSGYFGSGMSYAIALIVGGVLVGFGTQLAGGCTTGHGLSGMSRLIPVSIVATMAFFGAAVIVSLLIKLYAGT